MKKSVKMAVIGTAAGVLGMAGIAAASDVAVGVNVQTPNVSVRVGTPPPPPVIVTNERVVVVEKGDRGKHKGHYKKHKKHKHH